MARDTNVYSANRWSVGLLILVAGGVGLCLFLFYPILDAYLRSVPLRRTFGFLRGIPPEVTIWSARAVAAGLIAFAAVFARLVIDPRMVSVDAGGIEVRHIFSVHRGHWKDFVSMKAIGRKGMGTIELIFKTGPGGQPRVLLPPRLLGVDLEAAVAHMSVYIMEPKRPVDGSLDKYDPKKLAKQAAVASVEPLAVPVMDRPRRSFGKRSAAA